MTICFHVKRSLPKNCWHLLPTRAMGSKNIGPKAAEERLALRTAYLTEFINKRKAEKRKELADIIGYEALIDCRGLMLTVHRSLEKHPDYVNAKRNKDIAQGKLMKLCGRLLSSKVELFAATNEIVRAFETKVEITDETSYLQCIEELKGKIAQQEKAEKRLKLGELKRACESLTGAVKTAQSSETDFLIPYDKLVKNKEKVKLLDIEQFLSKGKDVLDKEISEPGKCPFCGKEVDIDHLKKEVAKRINELESIRTEFQGTENAKNHWLSCLRGVNRLAGER